MGQELKDKDNLDAELIGIAKRKFSQALLNLRIEALYHFKRLIDIVKTF